MKTKILSLLILGALVGIVSCSTSNNNSVTPSSATAYASVMSLGEEITTEQDTLQIASARLVFENLNMGASGGETYVMMPGQKAVSFSQENADQRQQLASSQISGGTYYSSEFAISLPEEISVEQSEYSIYLTGTYNGEQFEFGTDTTFSRGLNFTGGLNVPAQDAILELTIGTDLESWFHGDEGMLLNPGSAEEKREIEENIRPSFDIEVEGNIQ